MSKTQPGTDVLTDKSDRNLALVLGVLSTIAVVVAVVVAVASGSTAAWIVAGVTLVLVLVAVWAVRKAAAWHNPELFMPSSDPLRLGSHSVARFRRRARRAGSAQDATVKATLKCIESATYRVGTDSHTVTETLIEQELPVISYSNADVIEVDIEIDIPLFDGPPSMDLGNNEIRWDMKVEIDAPHAPDDNTRFPITVAPEVRS